MFACWPLILVLSYCHLFRYDLATASDLKYYAIPELQSRLEQLEARKAAEDAEQGGGGDTVTPEQIAEIVARWISFLGFYPYGQGLSFSSWGLCGVSICPCR